MSRTASEYARGSASCTASSSTAARPTRWSMIRAGALPGRKPGTRTCLAMLAYALSRLGLSSSKGTSTASRTLVGLRVSTVLFNALVSSGCDGGPATGAVVGELVGVAGFEPTAPRSQSECATKLRHTPAPSASVDGCARAYRYAGPCRTRV